ncbi:MAG: hypothetical protein AMXMBFR13_04820 [Phycisphaerae bacterium]
MNRSKHSSCKTCTHHARLGHITSRVAPEPASAAAFVISGLALACLRAWRRRPAAHETFIRCSTCALAAVVWLWGPADAAAQWLWKGDGNNNNWKNPANWCCSAGFPDETFHQVLFPEDAQRFGVDLSGDTRKVDEFRIEGANSYRFFNGKIRKFYGATLRITGGGSHVFDTDLIFEQVNTQLSSKSWSVDGSLVINGQLTGSGDIDLEGGGVLTLNSANPYVGTLTTTDGIVVIGHADALQNSTVNASGSNHIAFVSAANFGALAGDGDVNIGSIALTTGGNDASTTYSGALTGNSGIGPQLIHNGTGTFTLSGSISSVNNVQALNGLIVFDGASVSLNDPNLTGALILNGGDISIINGASVSFESTNASGGAVVINGQTLTIDGGSLSAPRIPSGASGVVDLVSDPTDGSALTIGKVGDFDVTSTFSGTLTGTGSFDKVGAGSLTLAQANTFSGNAIINGGSVVLGNSGALQNAIVTINVDDGLDLNGIDASIGDVAGAGEFDIGSTFSNVGGSASSLYSGDITGNSDAVLNKAGPGTWTLTGASSGIGDFDILEGTVVVDGGSVATVDPTASQNVQASLILRNGGAYNFGGNSTSVSGSLLIESGGSYAGDDIDTFGSWALTVRNGGMLTADQVALSGFTNDNGAFTVTGSSSVANIDSLTMGAAGLTNSSSTEVLAGAVLSVTGDTTFVQSNGHTLTINGGTFSTNRLIDAVGAVSPVALSDPAGNSALTVGVNNGSSTFDGLISDAAGGPGGITKVGAGTFRLTNANTFSGDTRIDGGKVILGNALALQDSTVLINVDNGLDINSLNANLGGLAGSGALGIGSQTVSVGANNKSTSYSGTLSGGTGSLLHKTGNGSLTLSGGTSGTPSSLGTLRALGGAFVVDGARIDLTSAAGDPAKGPILALGADITLQNGADVRFSAGAGFAESGGTLTITGSGTSLTGVTLDAGVFSGNTSSIVVEDNASLDLTSNVFIGFGGQGELTVQSGATAAANLLRLGIDASGTGNALVTGANSLLSTNNMDIGGAGSTPGGTGTLVVENGGAVQVSGQARLLTASSSITVDGGTWQTGRLLTGGGLMPTISLSDPTSGPALTVGTDDGDSTFDGLVQDATGGSGSISKVGAGTLTLTHANTFTGMTDIDGGQVILGNAGALQNSTVSINVDNGLDITTHSINANLGGLAGSDDLSIGSQVVTVGANNADTTYAGILTGDATSLLKHVGTGALTLTGDGSNLGAINTSAGTLNIQNADITLTSSNAGATLNANLGGAMNITGGSVVNVGSRGILARDGSVLTISGTGTQVTTTGKFQAAFDGGIVVENLASVSANSGQFGSNQTQMESGSITVQSGASVAILNATNLGQESGDMGMLAVTGAGSSYSTNLLNFGGSNSTALGGIGDATVNSGGTLTAHGTTTFYTSASSLSIDGGAFMTDTLTNYTGVVPTISISDPTSDHALTIGTGDGSSTWGGLIQDAAGGPGSIMKTGTGAFTLINANTYSGGTTIDGGTLLASNATGSATGAGTVQVNAGGTLGGDGNIAGTVTVATGGTLAPGASAGTLPLGSDLNLQAGSALKIELGGTRHGSDHDRLVVAGTANLGGTLDLSYINDFTATPDQSFVILIADTLTGSFDMVNTPDGQAWTIDYDTHAGIVTVAPCLDADGDGVCDADDVCPGFDDSADADADGVPDGCDLCPNTIPGAPVDSGGCPSPVIPADFDNDGDVDGNDLTAFQACARGPAIAMVAGCEDKDFDNDGDGDQSDFGVVQLCYSGQDSRGDPDCAD